MKERKLLHTPDTSDADLEEAIKKIALIWLLEQEIWLLSRGYKGAEERVIIIDEFEKLSIRAKRFLYKVITDPDGTRETINISGLYRNYKRNGNSKRMSKIRTISYIQVSQKIPRNIATNVFKELQKFTETFLELRRGVA